MRVFKLSTFPFFLGAVFIALAMDFPQTLWPFAFFFLVPILFYLDKAKSDRTNKIKSIRNMFLFGFTFSLFSTYWIISMYPLDWLGIQNPMLASVIIGSVWLCFSFVMAVPISIWAMFPILFKGSSPVIKSIIGASAWVLLEYGRSWFVALSIYSPQTLLGPHHTYYSLAYLAGGIPILKELLPIGGMYFASFVFILINYFIYYTWLRFKGGEAHRNSLGILFTIIFILLLTGLFTMRIVRGKDNTTTHFLATVVTSNIPTSQNKEAQERKRNIAIKALESTPTSTDIVILPENLNALFSPGGGVAINDPLLRQHPIVIGSYSGEEFSNLFFYDSVKSKVLFYRKQILMPIGEYGITWMNFLMSLLNQKEFDSYLSSGHFLQKGEHLSLFKSDAIKGVTIFGSLCSENISPYIYRDATKLGATVLLNLASHAPFHGSSLLSRQTLAINKVRALENGRYFITASNYGNSFVITDKGKLAYISTSTMEYFFTNVDIQSKTYLTPYVRYGDYMISISFLILSMASIWCLMYKQTNDHLSD